MRVTNYMIGKWAKAGLLILFGIILLLYFERVMNEMMPAFERMIAGEAFFLMQLLNAIGWIIIFWCFIDAALNILMSFRESKVLLDDIGAKLDAIEKKLSEQTVTPAAKPVIVEQGGVGITAATAAPSDPRLAPPMPPPPP